MQSPQPIHKSHKLVRIGWGLSPGWAGGIRTHGMTESKSVALPLGDSPVWRTRSLIAKIKLRVRKSGVEDGTRTHGLQSHNLAL